MDRQHFIFLGKATVGWVYAGPGHELTGRSPRSLSMPVRTEQWPDISRFDLLQQIILSYMPTLIFGSFMRLPQSELKVILRADEFSLPNNAIVFDDSPLIFQGVMQEMLAYLRDLNQALAKEKSVKIRFVWRAVRGEGSCAGEWLLHFSCDIREPT